MDVNLIFFIGSMTLVVVYLWFVSLQVVNARMKYGVQPPKTSGNKEFERIYRVQVNTYEASILYIPLFTLVFLISNGIVSSLVVLAWLVARVLYQWGYSKDVTSRTLGFKLQQVVFFASLGIIIVQMIRFFI